ncbi:MAG: Mobile element protein, partial [uncultured Chloroflexia bacterium]
GPSSPRTWRSSGRMPRAAHQRPARRLRRLEVDRACRGLLAHDAPRLPAVGGRLPANL